MPDLTRMHHPRVVAGDFSHALHHLHAGLSDANIKALDRSHGTFAVVVENAATLVWDNAACLAGVGIVVMPLPQNEPEVERFLVAGVPRDVTPGLSPLTDMLSRVVANYTKTDYDWFGDDRLTVGGRTLLMGVLNVTPDSFSDGGRFFDTKAAVEHGLTMAAEGADIIDVGGCSTRPGSVEPTEAEEIARTLPVIEKLRAKSDVPISIDTWRAEVAKRALDAGADVINDVTALTRDEAILALAASRDVPVVLMHMQGTPADMQTDPHYDDMMAEITRFLSRAVDRAEAGGVRRNRIAIDPGFGFGKTVRHNLEMLDRLHEFRSLGCPVLIGTSRKSTIGKVLDREADARLLGTAATVALAVTRGAAIVRVHDVREMTDVVRMTEAVLRRSDDH